MKRKLTMIVDSANVAGMRRHAKKLERLLGARRLNDSVILKYGDEPLRITTPAVFLGHKVAEDFGVRAPYFNWVPFRGKRAAVFPHPSGLNRWWNDEANRDTAATFLRRAAKGLQ